MNAYKNDLFVQDLRESLIWALDEAKPISHSFGNSKYYCRFCKSTQEYQTDEIIHEERCPYFKALQRINFIDTEHES